MVRHYRLRVHGHNHLDQTVLNSIFCLYMPVNVQQEAWTGMQMTSIKYNCSTKRPTVILASLVLEAAYILLLKWTSQSPNINHEG